MTNHQDNTPQPDEQPIDTPLAGALDQHDDVVQLQQHVEELTLALQRERADALNQRRHHEAQTSGLKSIIKASVVRDLLPVIDNFERALKHVPAELEGNDYIKGVQGVVKQFEKTLEQLGVTRIKTVDQPFDPHFHEAVSMDEDAEGDQEVVSEELQSGYTLGDEVIRHAMVRVTMR
jgi:molecular chaperone GrpE